MKKKIACLVIALALTLGNGMVVQALGDGPPAIQPRTAPVPICTMAQD